MRILLVLLAVVRRRGTWESRRAVHSRFNIDKVVAFLAVEAKSVLLKHPDQALEVSRAYAAIPLFHARREVVDRNELRRPPAVAFQFVAGFR